MKYILRNKRVQPFILMVLILFTGCRNEEIHNPADRILIVGELSDEAGNQIGDKQSSEIDEDLDYLSLTSPLFEPVWVTQAGEVTEHTATWELYSSQPLLIRTSLGRLSMVSPGDSIHIRNGKNGTSYSGKGSEKIIMWEKLIAAGNRFPLPTKNSFRINSFSDFIAWNNYVDQKQKLQLSILESYKNKIQPFEYEYTKAKIVGSTEIDRVHAFSGLLGCVEKNNPQALTSRDLKAIWDSTQYKPQGVWLRSLSGYHGDIYHIYAFIRMETQRKYDFNFQGDKLGSKDERTYAYFNTARNEYKGLLRERLLAYILDEPVISEMGLGNKKAQEMLEYYLSTPDYPEYKEQVRKLIELAKKKYS